MASLITKSLFSDTLQTFRKVLPFHEELPERISEEESWQMMSALPIRDREAPVFAASLSLRDMAVFCRMLALPEEKVASTRNRWEPVSIALLGKTYYLQLRAQVQFHPRHPVLLGEFLRCASHIRRQPQALARIERLLKSSHDDLVLLEPGVDPVAHLMREFLAHKTLLGIYAADQGLLRHAPLFHRFREVWFTQCGPDTYPLDGHEFLQALDLAAETVKLRMLAWFLQVHSLEQFPLALTHRLIMRYGKPDESEEWEEAEAMRVSAFGGDTGGDTGGDSGGDADVDAGGHADIDAGGHAGVYAGGDAKNGLSALHLWFLREQMKAHFGEDSLKYSVFNQFLRQLRAISYDGDREAIRLQFPSFVVMDFKPVQHFSWVCDPAELELRHDEMVRAMLDQGGQEPGYRRKRIPEAKDFVIEQDNGAAFRLTFAEVGRLYAVDMLSIRLGLQEREVWGVM